MVIWHCNKNEDGIGLEDLIDNELFEKSASIKNISKDKGEYFKIGENNFKWPEISHGTFTENNILYNLIIKKCDNFILEKSLGEGYHCQDDAELEKFFN